MMYTLCSAEKLIVSGWGGDSWIFVLMVVEVFCCKNFLMYILIMVLLCAYVNKMF